jgi:fructokinase
MMSRFKIFGIGEVLWDILPEGKQLGGAPANFVYHTNNLGANSVIISAIGDDILGLEIESTLKEKGIHSELCISSFPTGEVTVELHNGIPDYTIHEQVAWDNIQLNNSVKKELREADAICFGSLAQRSSISRMAIGQALVLTPEHALKIFDINLRQNYYSKDMILESLELANILKLNTEELVILSQFLNLDNNQENACNSLLERFNLKLVALTNGGRDSKLITLGKVSVLPTPKVEIEDTIGAGDSFTAAMVMALMREDPLEMVHRAAVYYSAKVCMGKGATPDIVL